MSETATFEEIEFDDEDDAVEEKKSTKKKPDDLFSVVGAVFSWANLKLIVFIFLIFVAICSDMFSEHVLSRFNGTVDGRVPNTKGTLIQGVFLVLFYIMADILVQYGII